jgi:Flp pilus assembly protein CpaB
MKMRLENTPSFFLKGLAAGLLFTFSCGILWAETLPATPEALKDMVSVLVPNEDIAVGAPLFPSMFHFESKEKDSVSQKVVKSLTEITGKFARSYIEANVPLHRDYITHIKPTNALPVLPDVKEKE